MQMSWITVGAQEAVPGESRFREFFDQLLIFLYSLAHWAGQLIANLVEWVSGYALPMEIIDPLGVLILLTAFLVLVEVAKRLAWIIVIVGWILILIRIVLEALGR
jgi:hypothetical protein